jgi:hypothetical protein
MSALNFYEDEVFVSYAWGGESERMVDELEKAFTERGIRIVRDKKELDYKGSIEAFEQRIGQGQCIVLVISDKYLRSEHCMYELVEADRNRNLRDRIFPLILTEAQIYKAIDRLNYIKYWDEQIEQLDLAIKNTKIMANLSGITSDLDKYASIRASIDHLTDLLSDMNTLTPEMHAASGFSTLIDAVERVMNKKGINSVQFVTTINTHGLSSREIEFVDSKKPLLKTYYLGVLAGRDYLAEFESKINQSTSNLGILITAQDEINDLAMTVARITEEIPSMDKGVAFPLSDLRRISELINITYNLVKSAAGLVAMGGNPAQQLNQISQNLPLLRNLIEQLFLWLREMNTANI